MYPLTRWTKDTIIACVGDKLRTQSGASKLLDEAREIKMSVLEGAACIEHEMATIISDHFFPQWSERAKDFDSMILRSNWFSFESKRKVVLWIVERRRLVEGKKKDELCKALSDTIKYRNAFTHGDLAFKGGSISISFFEGEEKTQELSDEYLKKVDEALNTAFTMTEQLARKPGASAAPEQKP